MFKTLDLPALLRRPEVLSLSVAILVSLAVAAGLPARAGLAIPEDGLTKVTALFWAVFAGAVFEGKYRGANYAGGLAQLLRGTKFRLAVVGLVVMVAESLADSAGLALPSESLTQLLDFLLAAILGVGALDGVQASRRPAMPPWAPSGSG